MCRYCADCTGYQENLLGDLEQAIYHPPCPSSSHKLRGWRPGVPNSGLKCPLTLYVCGSEYIFLGQGFSTSALLMFWPGSFFLVRACPVHCRIFNDIHGLYPLDASGTPFPVVMIKKISPDIAKCALGARGGGHKIAPG